MIVEEIKKAPIQSNVAQGWQESRTITFSLQQRICFDNTASDPEKERVLDSMLRQGIYRKVYGELIPIFEELFYWAYKGTNSANERTVERLYQQYQQLLDR